ncbi:MAG: hypothetical protein NUV60_03725, partial [Patescibacteria group bacterium]|nr:hypothetical protein [Patescibacteria group bacterium]
VIAGSSLVKVGSFKFTAQYSPFTVDKIQVKIPNGVATAVSSVTLRYPNESGVSTDSTAYIAVPTSEAYATATFTSLTFYIPSGTTKELDVYTNLSAIQTDGDSGRGVTVLLGDDGGFRSTNSAGTVSTDLASGDLASASTGKGTMYVRKSIPTLSAVALDSTTLTAGSNKTIARFKVTADAAGDVSWDKIAFNINKTFGITLGATTTVKLWQGSNAIAGNFATTTGSLLTQSQMYPVTDTSAATTDLNLVFLPSAEQTVSAGTSLTYELRTTVGGLASNGNSLDISIPNAQTTASTTAAASVVGVDGETDPSFTWSDRSSVATPHSTATSDWISDYLVNTLPLTVGNLSVTI